MLGTDESPARWWPEPGGCCPDQQSGEERRAGGKLGQTGDVREWRKNNARLSHLQKASDRHGNLAELDANKKTKKVAMRNQIAAGISWNDCRTAEREKLCASADESLKDLDQETVGEMDGYIAARLCRVG